MITHHFGAVALAAAAVCAMTTSAPAASLRISDVLMTGLVNPRGIAIGPDGSIYVSEAGSGGTGPTITADNGNTVGFGLTGAISVYDGISQSVFVSDLPSLAQADGADANGPNGLAFDTFGTLFATIGLGATAGARDIGLASAGGSELLGQLVRVTSTGITSVADLAAFEAANNPDGGGTGIDPSVGSNPYGVDFDGTNFIVADAGGNSVLSISPTGTITVLATPGVRDNPLPFGPSAYESVPTGVAAGPATVFAELTGFPFPQGAARVLEPDLTEVATGMTNLIDVAYGPDGTLYGLELDTNSLAEPGTAGALVRIGADGTIQRIFQGLTFPTALAVASNGDFLIADRGILGGQGRLLRVSAVPLPAALPLMLAGIAGLAFLGRRRAA